MGSPAPFLSAVVQLVAGQQLAIAAAFAARSFVESVGFYATRAPAPSLRWLGVAASLVIFWVIAYLVVASSSSRLGRGAPRLWMVAATALFAFVMAGPGWMLSAHRLVPLATGQPLVDFLLRGELQPAGDAQLAAVLAYGTASVLSSSALVWAMAKGERPAPAS